MKELESELKKDNPRPEEILKELFSEIDKPLTVHEICLLTGLNRSVVYKRLRKFSKWGEARKVTKKTCELWRVKSNE